MKQNIQQRLNKLEAENGKIHKVTYYCENVDGHQKYFETHDKAITYEKQNPGWYAEMKFTFPNGNVLIWDNATLHRMRRM